MADTPVDLQLVLAVDASGSVNQYRFELQKQGYAAAFRNPARREGDPLRDRRRDRGHGGAVDRARICSSR